MEDPQPILASLRYFCPHCQGIIHVHLTRGQTLEEQFALHKIHCTELNKQNHAQKVCQHLGPVTEEEVNCQGCGSTVRTFSLFSCEKHGRCLPFMSESFAKRNGVRYRTCLGCPDKQEVPLMGSPIAEAAVLAEFNTSAPEDPEPPVNKLSNKRMGPYG